MTWYAYFILGALAGSALTILGLSIYVKIESRIWKRKWKRGDYHHRFDRRLLETQEIDLPFELEKKDQWDPVDQSHIGSL